jgi:hypothetical protein
MVCARACAASDARVDVFSTCMRAVGTHTVGEKVGVDIRVDTRQQVTKVRNVTARDGRQMAGGMERANGMVSLSG